MTLKDFLDRVEGVYKSIDLRIVAAKSNDVWQNVLTVVRFSCKEVEELEDQQKELEARWGKVQTENFRMELQAFTFFALQFLCEQFNEGKWFFFGDGDVQFGRSIAPLSLDGRFEKYGYMRREVDTWPYFEACVGEHSPLLKDERLQSEVKSQTIYDVYTLIRELLEVDFSSGLSLDFIVAAPFYAFIEHVDFAEQRCKIQVRFHKDIKALAVSAIVRRGDQENAPVSDKASSTFSALESEESGEYMRLWTGEFELLNATPADHLYVNLIQRQPTALDVDVERDRISRLLELKKPAKEPLLAAFQRFCTLDELEEYLKNPIQAGLVKKDASATFELAVAWLLGLCGFNIIWLGQTKHEAMKEDKATRFSVDILAYYQAENTVLLVGCTIGIPRDDDIDNMKSVQRALLDEVFKDTQPQVMPCIFSAAPALSSKDRDGVRLLDTDDIRGILNYVRQGDIPHAISDYFGFPFKP